MQSDGKETTKKEAITDITASCSGKCDHNCKVPYEPNRIHADVMEAVSLFQTSLLHILNIDAERIQGALACSNSAGGILKVNDEVKNNLTIVLHLEQLLFALLDLYNEVLKRY